MDEFDFIAEELDSKRKESWKPVETFIKSLQKGSLCLDIGCGNGRDCKTLIDNGVRAIGLDSSEKIIQIASKNVNTEFVAGDATNLQFKDESFDNILCIAMLHHLGSENKRIRALKEISRVLKKDGRCLISIWWKRGLVGDRNLNWIGNKEIFYHFFSKDELTELVKKAGLKLERNFLAGSNFYLMIKKN